MSTWIRSVAIAAASAVTLTLVPTVASAAPQPVASSSDLQATAQEVAHNFVVDQISADGNTVSLKKGSFRLASTGNAIDFVGENGRTLMQAPLQGFFGESVVALRAAIGNGGSTLTLSPGHVIRQATQSELQRKASASRNISAWFDIYGDYARYAAKHDPGNFFGGLVLGSAAGLVGGWALLLVLEIPLIFVNMILIYSIIGIPVYYTLLFAYYGTAMTIGATNISALMSAKLAKDPIARKKANRVLRATQTIFTGGDVSRVR